MADARVEPAWYEDKFVEDLDRDLTRPGWFRLDTNLVCGGNHFLKEAGTPVFEGVYYYTDEGIEDAQLHFGKVYAILIERDVYRAYTPSMNLVTPVRRINP